ncbi:kelch repeat protein [Ichthyophthirius multifiliis]|uniref:Kelch repeat protein n=1 Tax=Ichthyophthirius multifiliis TaxID=5932 RepID=G0QKN3_ICHMU|nr:kelch repeat protein [Ichthyophthirius multifiliis]EGR34231.1 kelch repeat protein [Ichthyophthirius multifiliis]|eukprot:XP_004039535.1 kelch repeat protein [Ichthyophthirius multifiliis]
MILHCSAPQKLIQIIINPKNFQIEQKTTLNTDDCLNLDTTFFHKQTFYVNNRIYFIQNSISKDNNHIYCADFDLKKLFPIKNIDTKPSSFRINYSAVIYMFKIYIFGGLNDNNQPTNMFDSFDISTYKWEKVSTSGKLPLPRHSHCCEIIENKMILFGGTKSNDIFDRECFYSDINVLDLKTQEWIQLNVNGQIPKYMAYGYSFKIEDNLILFLWNDRANDSHEMECSVLDLNGLKWSYLDLLSKKPELRYSAASCYNEGLKQVIFYGGFSFTQNEINCVVNDLDQLLLFKDENAEVFSQLELYGGDTYEQNFQENIPSQVEEIKNDYFYKESIVIFINLNKKIKKKR